LSRGSIRWEDEEGPPVGRGQRPPVPLYASTPLDFDGREERQKDGRESDYEVKDMQLTDSGHGYVDVTNWQIKHLTELLESERRLVRVLSSMSNLDLDQPKKGGLVDERLKEEMPGEANVDVSLEMPVLEDMRPGRLEEVGDLGDGRLARCNGPTARELYNQSGSFDKILNPNPVEKEVKQDVRKDLRWYEDYLKPCEPQEGGDYADKKVPKRKEERYLPRMKPSYYDGQTPYEDYQVQFNMLADLNEWTDDVKALYLAGCLTGSARSVLNDMDPKARYEFGKLNEALRERFGTDDQSELFKAKLRNRVKTKEETLQELAHDIRRLVRLAYPKAPVRTHNDLTKDQFIEALGDSEIRWSVFQARPKSITEALKVAMELEAFKESEKCRMRRNIRGVKTEGIEMKEEGDRFEDVEDGEIPRQLPLGLRQMAAQISQMHQMGRGFRGPEGRLDGSKPMPADKEETQSMGPRVPVVGTTPGRSMAGPGERGYGNPRAPFDLSRIKCYRCDKPGHYVRDCPDLLKREPGSIKPEGSLNA
jgi:hypothetical protein